MKNVVSFVDASENHFLVFSTPINPIFPSASSGCQFLHLPAIFLLFENLTLRISKQIGLRNFMLYLLIITKPFLLGLRSKSSLLEDGKDSWLSRFERNLKKIVKSIFNYH